jgi:hypothetical protein
MTTLTLWQEVLHLFLAAFVCLAFGLLLKSAASIVSKGLQCVSAFGLMWVFAYGMPTLLYLMTPKTFVNLEGYGWMGVEEWSLAALAALVGLLSFGLGYRLGKRRRRSDRKTQTPSLRRNTLLQFAFLLAALTLQLYPLFLIVSRGIAVNHAHRSLHWEAVGLTIRFGFFALPSVAIAYWLFLQKRSMLRLIVLGLTLVVSVASAFSLGARMFLILVPIVMFLVHANRFPRKRLLLFVTLACVAFSISVGYLALFRSDNPDDLANNSLQVLASDVGRMHTLAYTSQHVNLISSKLLKPPVLGSYFYWLILPIPRSFWSGKPYATNLQFSFWFRAEHTNFYVPYSISEMSGSTEFGFIDEAMLNLGVSGVLIVALLGYLAARLDNWIQKTRYLRVAVPIFFLLGTIYSFNGILNYLAPFLIIAFLLDRRALIQSRRGLALPTLPVQSHATIRG